MSNGLHFQIFKVILADGDFSMELYLIICNCEKIQIIKFSSKREFADAFAFDDFFDIMIILIHKLFFRTADLMNSLLYILFLFKNLKDRLSNLSFISLYV